MPGPSGRLSQNTESAVLCNDTCSMQALILPLQYKPASCSSWNTQLVVVLEMAAFPSIRSFLAAFPAVIWSLDCIRTHPGISGSSYTSFVLPSLTFLPSFSSREKNKIKAILDAKSFGRVRQHAWGAARQPASAARATSTRSAGLRALPGVLGTAGAPFTTFSLLSRRRSPEAQLSGTPRRAPTATCGAFRLWEPQGSPSALRLHSSGTRTAASPLAGRGNEKRLEGGGAAKRNFSADGPTRSTATQQRGSHALLPATATPSAPSGSGARYLRRRGPWRRQRRRRQAPKAQERNWAHAAHPPRG